MAPACCPCAIWWRCNPKEAAPPTREIVVRLQGNMERYIWTLNGKKFGEGPPIDVKFGERVRITFINETMMAHPMHLHGMFFEVENGQAPGLMPEKNVIVVAPGRTQSIILTANEAGEWPLHCHLLYHMNSGMMQKLVVANVAGRMASRPGAAHTPLMRALCSRRCWPRPAAAPSPPRRPRPRWRHQQFTLVEEADITRFDGKWVANWEAQGWIGSDMDKFWWRTEGETKGPRLEQSEFQALYSRNIAMFFDAQVGLRHDIRPMPAPMPWSACRGWRRCSSKPKRMPSSASRRCAAAPAPEFDLRMTNRLVVQPLFETDIYLTREPERLIAPGPAIIEAGVLTRYEITRRVAPYVAVMFERRLGESSRLARAAGENPGGWSIRL
jgi:copper resistance protein B